MAHRLHVLAAPYAIARLAPDASVPDWARGELVSVTRTPDELSIVAAQSHVPVDAQGERDWRVLRVQGPLAFDMVGVLADLAGCLATAGISIFAISTHDTDYLAVKSPTLADAIAALRAAGHEVVFPDAP